MEKGYIKVRLEKAQGGFGWVLRPVNPKVAAEIAASNQYDGSSEVFCQDTWELDEMDLPRAAWSTTTFCGRKVREPNDGATFQVDPWEFRQWVGGQSD